MSSSCFLFSITVPIGYLLRYMYTFDGSESGVEYSRRMTTRVHRSLRAVYLRGRVMVVMYEYKTRLFYATYALSTTVYYNPLPPGGNAVNFPSSLVGGMCGKTHKTGLLCPLLHLRNLPISPYPRRWACHFRLSEIEPLPQLGSAQHAALTVMALPPHMVGSTELSLTMAALVLCCSAMPSPIVWPLAAANC